MKKKEKDDKMLILVNLHYFTRFQLIVQSGVKTKSVTEQINLTWFWSDKPFSHFFVLLYLFIIFFCAQNFDVLSLRICHSFDVFVFVPWGLVTPLTVRNIFKNWYIIPTFYCWWYLYLVWEIFAQLLLLMFAATSQFFSHFFLRKIVLII